jgi:hypothetical protein
MPKGDRRRTSFPPSKWKHGKTKPVRVPIVLEAQVLEAAHELDNGEILVWSKAEDSEDLPCNKASTPSDITLFCQTGVKP